MKLKNDIGKFVQENYECDFKFKDFKDHLTYPLFKEEGRYSDLDCSNEI